MALIALMVCLAALPRTGQAIDRRKPQFLTEPSYLIFPIPYSLPGIGSGIVVTGLAGNVAGSHVDAFALVITGDAVGSIVAVEDIHLIEETLIFDYQIQNINKAVVNSYEQRGMRSDGDRFNLVEVSQADADFADLTLSLYDRRLELFSGVVKNQVAVTRIRDKNGNLIAELFPEFQQETETRFIGFVVDYTDDRQDPRKGIRLEAMRSRSPPATAVDPDFFVWDVALTGYIPIGSISTLVIHAFRSDAQVVRVGETDPAAIRAELGLNCAPLDTQCLQSEAELVAQFQASRLNGTSTSLGGDERLRSYPQGRFQGAHTVFYALEFRWNLSEESTPFDYFIWKDIRTSFQIALFAETGSVGETRDEVGDVFASTYGAGLRLVTGSGFVYRADIATGKEGTEAVLIFSYPF